MEHVAALAGVSRSLVSLVMRGSDRPSDSARTAVLEAANALGYRPNLMARNLASKRTHTIGVVLNDLHNPFFADIADGIAASAHAAGYRVILNSGQRQPRIELAAVATFLEFRTDGIIIVGAESDDGDLADLVNAHGCPAVVVGRQADHAGLDSVSTDDFAGAELAIQHLADLGHRKIAHLSGGRGAGAPQRRHGYEVAMAELGLAEHLQVIDGEFTEESGYRGAQGLIELAEPPTAIFASNDLIAVGAIHALDRSGLTVPDSMSIVGYDNTRAAGLTHLSLTSVNQPRERMGQLSVETIVDRLDNGATDTTHIRLDPDLVLRSSTRRIA